jgi:predicted dehydrogenase
MATGHYNSIKLRVYGTLGALEINIYPEGDSLRFCLGKDINKYNWKEIKYPKLEIPAIHKRFIKSIIKGKQDKPDFKDGWKIQKYIEKSFISNKLKKWIKI